MALSHHGDCQVSECLLQDLRSRGLRGSKRWTAEDLRPFVEHAIASFGWERVLFGSDWPVCTLSASYQTVGGGVAGNHGRYSEVNRRKLFYDNAVRVYRLS